MTRQVNLIAGEPQEFYEVSDFFRLLSAVDPVTVEFYSAGREVSEAVGISKGYAEKFDRGTFDRVRLLSSTTQAVQFVTRLGNVVQYDAAPIGDTAIVSSVPLSLDAATLAGIVRPMLPTGSWSSGATMAANTPLTIFTAAANVNGAVLLAAESHDFLTGDLAVQSFVAKATAPTGVLDGEVILMAINEVIYPSVSMGKNSRLAIPQRIAPGLGLYFISEVAGSAVAKRYARYALL